MNEQNAELRFRTTPLSCEPDDYQDRCNGPKPDLDLEAIARYREIYRQKIDREERQLWARLQAWVRKAGWTG